MNNQYVELLSTVQDLRRTKFELDYKPIDYAINRLTSLIDKSKEIIKLRQQLGKNKIAPSPWDV